MPGANRYGAFFRGMSRKAGLPESRPPFRPQAAPGVQGGVHGHHLRPVTPGARVIRPIAPGPQGRFGHRLPTELIPQADKRRPA